MKDCQIHKAITVVVLAVLVFLFWQLRHVLVVACAAVVIATLLVSAGDFLRRFTPLSHSHAVSIGGVFVWALLSLTIWATWPQIMAQSSNLLEQLGTSLTALQDRTGINLPDSLAEMPDSAAGMMGSVWNNITALAGTLLSAIAGLILVVAAGTFLAIDPSLYRDGLVQLLPKPQHQLARSALDRTGRGLKLWLIGKLISMAIIGVLVGLGAWAIGLPAPFALGVVAALLEFLPLIGPVLGAIPGLLIAFSQGWTVFFWALALYVVVQQLESNVITPSVLQRAVAVPPALFLFSVLGMGTLFGTLGVILSGPLTVIVFVLVRALYVEDILGQDLDAKNGI